MSNNHPITPPPELVLEWNKSAPALGANYGPYGFSEFIATQAARWGADQELEACCEWLGDDDDRATLRAARRPKPAGLKEQALAALTRLKTGALCVNSVTDETTIRRALEQLDD